MRQRLINIPKTKEYGWEDTQSGSKHFRPTIKSFWNRVEYIVQQRGGRLIKTTTGFTVEGIELSDTDTQLIAKEMKQVDLKSTIPDDLTINDSGREEPNVDNF